MRHVTRNAPPPLDRYIETFWYWEGEPLNHLKDTILASACAGLLINLTGDRLGWYEGVGFSVSHHMRGIGVVGPSSRSVVIDAFHRKMMGVKFRPAGALPFFGVPMSALADRHVSLVDLWGSCAERLLQRLMEAPAPDDKFVILIEALNEKVREGFEYHPAVSYALGVFARRGRASIAAVAGDTGLSQSKFIQLFSEQVGFRPKLHLRIARFQRVLDQIARAPDVNWGDIVEWNGYYDQSHFINDFEDFSGLSPSIYLKRRGPHVRHIPIPT